MRSFNENTKFFWKTYTCTTQIKYKGYTPNNQISENWCTEIGSPETCNTQRFPYQDIYFHKDRIRVTLSWTSSTIWDPLGLQYISRTIKDLGPSSHCQQIQPVETCHSAKKFRIAHHHLYPSALSQHHNAHWWIIQWLIAWPTNPFQASYRKPPELTHPL